MEQKRPISAFKLQLSAIYEPKPREPQNVVPLQIILRPSNSHFVDI